ncbi:hypothetical protein R0J91_19725, partial [Micrococcus sp. SIMBA_131]
APADELTAAARDRRFPLLFADRHPHAGGPDHYAAYRETADGFEVELVAVEDCGRVRADRASPGVTPRAGSPAARRASRRTAGP